MLYIRRCRVCNRVYVVQLCSLALAVSLAIALAAALESETQNLGIDEKAEELTKVGMTEGRSEIKAE